MLGSAVSSSTPRDFQPSPHMGARGSPPVMKRHAALGPAMGCAYAAVGMQRALDSAIGLPRRPMRASWMLRFLMPAEVRSNFTMTLLVRLSGIRSFPARQERAVTRLAVETANCRFLGDCHNIRFYKFKWKWRTRRDSNPRHPVPKTGALSAELRVRA